jgi:hypothetical protein
VCVEFVAELLRPDLVFVSKFALFLDEKVMGFGTSSFYVGFEGLLDLKFDGGEFGSERSFAGGKFVVKNLAEVGRSSSDFSVEVASVL